MEISNMNFGNFYAEVYNDIHFDKNYFSEAQQIISIIEKTSGIDSKILDFGCGTGKHVRELINNGFDVSGYDLNINMIKVARINAGDINFYDTFESIPGKFDFAYSLFDVLSYQIEDSDIDIFLSNIKSKVKSNGFVLLDGWHTPALIKEPPESRVKTFKNNGIDFLRSVTVLDFNYKSVATLGIEIKKLDSTMKEFSEIHKLRSLRAIEIEEFIINSGGRNIKFYNGTDYSKSLTDFDWRFAVSYQV